ncbi:MAG TPA: alpha-amylase/4-alpha-glucanotransferase domain-containing protein [Candidatus Deferrimicrobiaceae bacterium]
MLSSSGPAPARTLLLCLHNHQPVGNFDFVLEEACRNSYLPFLETLERFPGIRLTLHYSGFLLRWIADNSPEVLRLLREMVSRGQVEILGGGMYEPILALLPERDRLGQIRALSENVRACFGREPEGAWLAERVWEPDLAASLAASGVKYLPLDDYHFIRAGLGSEELDGVWLTEAGGSSVRVFPGSELLRYLIPFGDVEETLRAVERMTSRDVPYPAAIFADDGEKLGVWPGTHKSVYDEGWLRRFFEGIWARRDWLTTMTFGEYAARAPLRGRIYLPTCSYIEMGEWALPPGRAARFGDMLHEFRAGGMAEMKPFVQGGFFRNFLRKYEEANQLHKRMWWVSGRVEEASRRSGEAAGRDFLYRAQCNDVYWHGVFGGLYLNHLREAAYQNLLRAEEASDRVLHAGKTGWTEGLKGDLDLDGGSEVLLKTPALTLLVHAHDGGAVTEISLPQRGVALGHVLTRREEGYHAKLRRGGGTFDGSTSIHDIIVLKDPSVMSALSVDGRQRASFREALYLDEDPPERILDDSVHPAIVTAGKETKAEITRSGSRIVLSQQLPLSGPGIELELEKILDMDAGDEGFVVRYRIFNRGRETFSARFVSEWNLNFLSGNGPDRRYEGIGPDAALSSRGVTAALREFRIVDAWRNVEVKARADRDFTLLRYPVETASLSEAGAEKIHQGVCLRLLFPIRIPPGDNEYYSLFWSVISVAP